ncbi:hypothetical protein V8E52_004374 [Russula decolorans]
MATLRRVGGPWSRAWLISFFALFLFFSYLAFSSSPRIRQQDNLRVWTVFRLSTCDSYHTSPFHFPFLLYLSLHSLGQHLPTPRHYHAAAICSLFHLFLAFPLCTYTYSPTLFSYHYRHPRVFGTAVHTVPVGLSRLSYLRQHTHTLSLSFLSHSSLSYSWTTLPPSQHLS